jgi:hypothetical protein
MASAPFPAGRADGAACRGAAFGERAREAARPPLTFVFNILRIGRGLM